MPSIVDTGKIDKIIKITDEEAVSCWSARVQRSIRRLQQRSGMCAAQKLAKEAQGDIVFIVPDTE